MIRITAASDYGHIIMTNGSEETASKKGKGMGLRSRFDGVEKNL